MTTEYFAIPANSVILPLIRLTVSLLDGNLAADFFNCCWADPLHFVQILDA